MLKGKLSQQVWEAFGLMQECNSKIRRLQTTVRNIENMGINKFPDMRDREVISQITLSLDIDAQEWKSMQFIKNGDELRVLISGLQKQINQYNSNLLTPHWHQTKRDPTEELKEISRKAEIAENHISKIKPKQDSLWKTMFGSNRKATCSLEEDYNQAVNSMD
jgi:hypothetical protein